MRQQHPLSPAVHLGADRLLVIGVRARRDAGVTVNRAPALLPTPGEVFGYMLDTLFTDQIYGDLEQLERMNDLVRSAPETTRGERTIETLMLAPSVDPREIAARHVAQMPRRPARAAARDRRPRRIRRPAGELPDVRGAATPAR